MKNKLNNLVKKIKSNNVYIINELKDVINEKDKLIESKDKEIKNIILKYNSSTSELRTIKLEYDQLEKEHEILKKSLELYDEKIKDLEGSILCIDKAENEAAKENKKRKRVCKKMN